MADYGLKYYCDYRSPMRGTLLYRIDIEERGSTNTDDHAAEMLRPYSDVFTIKQGGSDDAEYTAIKGSTVTLKILCVDDMKYLSLFTTDPRKYRLTIYEYRDDSQGSPVKLILWRGFLAANSYKEEFAKPPYVVTLSATDGLSLLTAIPFRNANGEKFAGLKSVYDLLSDALEVLELDMPLCEWTNLNGNTSDTPSLKEVYIDTSRIYDATKDPNWCDVLKLGSESFIGQVFQAGGVFHVRRIASLCSASRPELFTRNWSLLGKPRPVVHELWQKSTDVSGGSEISMLSPYKLVDVELGNTKQQEVDYYETSRWVKSGTHAVVRILKDRVYINGSTPRLILSLSNYAPSSNIEINISCNIHNAMRLSLISKLFVLYKYGEDENISGGRAMYWDFDKKIWSTRGLGLGLSEVIEKSDFKTASPYMPIAELQSKTIRFTITGIPDVDGICGELFLWIDASTRYDDTGVISAAGAYFVSDINVETNLGDNAPDHTKLSLPISSANFDKCSWSTPIRDGGYNTNPLAGMPNVLTDSTGKPIVSWISRAEHGDLMNVVADDIRMLRSNVSRQIDGELRCPDGVDLNSLFYDGKFTNAVYYINSLELLAQRQIYKVQLRELLNTKLVANTNAWTTLHTFDSSTRLVTSLNGVLFLRSASGVLSLFNTETHDVLVLPYVAGPKVRKGLGAVIIPVGDTDLYAIDNVGNVLSHLDATTSDILDYASALYDANRELWVSAKTGPDGKALITVLTANLELESQVGCECSNPFILLATNGYLVQSAFYATSVLRWHNYDLHPNGSLEEVYNKATSVDKNQYYIAAISDTFIIKGYTNPLSFEVCRRYGTMIQSKPICTAPMYMFGQKLDCNNKLAAIYHPGTGQIQIVEASGRTHRSPHNINSITVSGDAVYITENGVLSCYSIEDRFTLPEVIA